MKKRLLLVIDNLHTGGVGTSLYNFLYFSHNAIQIDLLVFNEDSIDYSRIPEDVHVIRPDKCLHILGKCHDEIKQESFILMSIRVMLSLLARRVSGVFARKVMWPFVSSLNGYDLAIAYAQDDGWRSLSKGCVDYIINKVSAKRKSVIIHCDYCNFGGYDQRQIQYYRLLDFIICVSKSCCNSFVKCFPTLENKVYVCENFIKTDEIIKKAGDGIVYPKDTINFVSICRLSIVKGLDRTIKAFREISDAGINNFYWVIVGGGPEYDSLNRLINENNLSNKIKLIGENSNPYQYLKLASCLLVPSYHEAAPMVFGEANCLGVPVLTTDTCSAKELVEKRNIGIVVNNDYEGIRNGLLSFISNTISYPKSDVDEMDFNKIPIGQLDRLLNSL